MNRITASASMKLIFGSLVCCWVILLAPDAMADSGELVKVGSRSYAWIATDERSANSALFVGDSAALVVDPGLTPAIADEFLPKASLWTIREWKEIYE